MNEGIHKELTTFVPLLGSIRVVVAGSDTTAIANGETIIVCTAHVLSAAAPGGRYGFVLRAIAAFDAQGQTIAIESSQGVVSIPELPTATGTPTSTPTETPTGRPLPECKGPCDGPRSYAFVSNFASDSVSVIDASHWTTIATIDLPVGAGPKDIAVSQSVVMDALC